jgi:hypothetical protein
MHAEQGGQVSFAGESAGLTLLLSLASGSIGYGGIAGERPALAASGAAPVVVAP